MILFKIEDSGITGEVHKEGLFFSLKVKDKDGNTLYDSVNYKTPGRPVNKFYWYLKYHYRP